MLTLQCSVRRRPPFGVHACVTVTHNIWACAGLSSETNSRPCYLAAEAMPVKMLARFFQFSLAFSVAVGRVESSSKPNIIFILADDLVRIMPKHPNPKNLLWDQQINGSRLMILSLSARAVTCSLLADVDAQCTLPLSSCLCAQSAFSVSTAVSNLLLMPS